MKIKLAYDISIIGNHFYRSDFKVGIVRTAESIIHELNKRDDISLTFTSLSNCNYAFSGLGALAYVQESINQSSKIDLQLKSRAHILFIYKTIFGTFFSKSFQTLPKYSLFSLVIRSTLKLLMFIQKFDVYPIFESKNHQIFFSPFTELPPASLTGESPRVLMIHDLIPLLAPQLVAPSVTAYMQRILNSIDQQQDWIVCNSEFTKREFCDYTGMSSDRVFVTYLAATDDFKPVNSKSKVSEVLQRYGIPRNYFVCVASHLEPRKNLPHLIRCFSRLLTENPTLEINLVLIGSQRFTRQEVLSAKDSSQFNSNIILTGYIEDEDLSAIYSAAIAFIFPSLYEGFGLPILEAMQCGAPVIASAATSIPEVVGDAGILIDPQDENALCQAMFDVLVNEELRQELREKGLARSQQFSWAKCVEQIVTVFKKALDSR